MALFRKFFYKRPPDGLLEIYERVYVFDCCFTTEILEDEEYKVYIGSIVDQLLDHFPDGNFMVFNFREGEKQTQIDYILPEYDMTVINYPRHYEGCPLLTVEMIHHYLRSTESWLTLGQQNVLLMHCERGGWPVLAFMLAALLIYKKQFTGEQKTLDMIYRQAPRELLQWMSPLNPLPSQLRYLQYISRRNVGSGWPPLDRALTLDCIIIRAIPNADGEGGFRPIFRIYGQDPLMVADRTPKVLFSTQKRSELVRNYKQADCELVKIDIHCHIQGDVVLECISLDSDQEREKMMFRVMFNTTFIRSNILMLNCDEIDILWNAKDQFPKDFRAEIIFSEMDAGNPFVSFDFPSMEEDDLPIEVFAKVKEIFSNVDWLDPKYEVGLDVLQHITPSIILQENLEVASPQSAETITSLVESALEKVKEKQKLVASENNIISPMSTAQGNQSMSLFKPSPDVNSIRKKIEPQELQVAVQRPAQSKIISQRLPQTSLSPNSYSNSLQGSPVPSSRYHSVSPVLGITALLHDHDTSNSEEVTHQVTKSLLPSASSSSHVKNLLKPLQLSHVFTPPPQPPPLPPSLQSLDASTTIQKTCVNSPPPPPPPLPQPTSKAQLPEPILQDKEQSLSVPSPSEASISVTKWSNLAPPALSGAIPSLTAKNLLTIAPSRPPPSFSGAYPSLTVKNSSQNPPHPSPSSETSPSSSVKNSFSAPPPAPAPPSILRTSPLSSVKNSFLAPPPPPPPPCFSGTSPSSVVNNSFSDPPPPPHCFSGTSPSSSVKNLFSTPCTLPLPPSFLRTSPSSTVKNLFSNPLPPPPPPPPPLVASSPSCSVSSPLPTKSSASFSGPPPPPPLSSGVPVSTSSAPPAPPPIFAPKVSLSNNSGPASPMPSPPAHFSKALSSPKSGGASPKSYSGLRSPRSQPRKANLKPYHWLKLTRAMQGSLWAETQKSDEASKAPEFDISELECLFSAAPSSDHGNKGGKSNRRSSGPKSEKVQLIELRRAYNCEIMLTKVKIPLPDLMSSVLALDDSALDVDQVDNLIKFCPTKEEMELLNGYRGDKENLGKCEQCFLELMKVPRVESKLRVFSFKIQFCTQVSDLRKNLNIINSGSEEIRNSVKLKRIMQSILSLGNALNHGTARGYEFITEGSAVGFRLDSLLKLTDTRARNNKMTLMHYLCKVLAEKLPELIDFAKDLVSLEASTKIQLKYLAEEMQAISKGLEKVVQELIAAENDGPVSESFCMILKEFLGFAEGEVRSLASLYSNVGRNADALAQYFGEDPARCPFEQVVSTLLNFVRMFDRAHQENCKQLEFEKKQAEKEAENEKLKTSGAKKGAEQLIQTPFKSSSIN